MNDSISPAPNGDQSESQLIEVHIVRMTNGEPLGSARIHPTARVMALKEAVDLKTDGDRVMEFWGQDLDSSSSLTNLNLFGKRNIMVCGDRVLRDGDTLAASGVVDGATLTFTTLYEPCLRLVGVGHQRGNGRDERAIWQVAGCSEAASRLCRDAAEMLQNEMTLSNWSSSMLIVEVVNPSQLQQLVHAGEITARAAVEGVMRCMLKAQIALLGAAQDDNPPHIGEVLPFITFGSMLDVLQNGNHELSTRLIEAVLAVTRRAHPFFWDQEKEDRIRNRLQQRIPDRIEFQDTEVDVNGVEGGDWSKFVRSCSSYATVLVRHDFHLDGDWNEFMIYDFIVGLALPEDAESAAGSPVTLPTHYVHFRATEN